MGKLKKKRNKILDSVSEWIKEGNGLIFRKRLVKGMKEYSKYFHEVKSQSSLMTDPVHFGRWALKNAEMAITDQASYCWKYEDKMLSTDELYLKFVNEIEEGF